MDGLRNILNDPGKCLRLGVLSCIVGIGFIALGLFGPSKLTYLRFVSIVFFIVAYSLFRIYFRHRSIARRNQAQQPVEPAPYSVQFQQPVADNQAQQPYPTAGGTYGFAGMQNQPSTANDPSLPPPYPATPWPTGQQPYTANNGDLPPPPSYDEVVRGSR